MNGYLSVFEGLSHYVEMMPRVMKDLQFFILYYLLFIVTFGAFLTILADPELDNPERDGLPWSFY